MTKVIRFHRTGGPEVLSYDDFTFDAPAEGELLIRVAAIGLNRVELMYRAGEMGPPAGYPGTLGSEGAGVIEAIGPGVNGFAVGDRIATIPGFATLPGFTTDPLGHACSVYGEKAYVPAVMAVKIPDGLSFIEGASIWMQYATAYSALVEVAAIGAGDFVLITAASSSVGIAAIQIANSLGAVPIATTRGRAKAEALRAHGAAHVIVTGEQDLAAEVRRITGGLGARVIYDPIAGATMPQLVAAAAYGGRIIIYGTMDADLMPVPVAQAVSKALAIHFTSQFEVSLDPAKRARLIRFVLEGLDRGDLKPVIDRVFRFDQLPDAHRYLDGQQHIGKVVVEVG